MQSGNPVLTANALSQLPRLSGDTMTIGGAVNKSFLLLLFVVAGAYFAWNQAMTASTLLAPLTVLGAAGGFAMALVTIFKKEWSPVTAPIYAVLEGLVLGAVSALAEQAYPGIVLPAITLTFGTLLSLLAAYRSGLIRASENFKLGVVAATGGIAIVYLVDLVLGFFHTGIPLISQSGPVGIGFSLFVVVIAALNLVIDFDFIERAAASGAPRYMEWYGAFGLMVTLVWLYIEFLRLLMKIQGSRR